MFLRFHKIALDVSYGFRQYSPLFLIEVFLIKTACIHFLIFFLLLQEVLLAQTAEDKESESKGTEHAKAAITSTNAPPEAVKNEPDLMTEGTACKHFF